MKDFRNLGIEEWLRMFWRRKWYFILTAVIVSGGVTVYAWRLPEFYRSETRIQVQDVSVAEDLVRSVVRMTPYERMMAIRDQFQSRSFLQGVVEESNLLGFGTRKDFVMEQAVGTLLGGIKVDIGSSNIFALSFTSPDPQFALFMTRTLRDVLIKKNDSARVNKAHETDRFIDDQLRVVETQLAAQEKKIEQFKIAHLSALPEQGQANLDALARLTTQLAANDSALDQAREQRKQLDIRLQEQKRLSTLSRNLLPADSAPVASAREKDAPSPNQELATKKALLKGMLTKYTKDHPDVQLLARQVAELEQQAAASADATGANTSLTPLGATGKPAEPVNAAGIAGVPIFDLDAAEIKVEIAKADNEITTRLKQKDEIQRQINVCQSRFQLAPSLELEMSALSRDREVLRREYNDLQNKKFSAQMAANLQSDPSAAVLTTVDEPSLPGAPAFPDRRQIALMGFGAGILLGLGAIFLRELLDPTLGSEEEAASVLNLPVLAFIPEVSSRGLVLQKRNRRRLGAA
ncbi:MAG: hypothetical protein LAP85_06250 [Acidobacteriia bacterium]|nr:hypothetical protein [Terriglobia bacterium]